jgi:signal transduction histidine kinase
MVLWIAVASAGLVSERVAYGFDDPGHWAPDLAVGLAFLGAGAYARLRDRGTGTLLMATGFSWFVGNFVGWAQLAHRGPLVHAVGTYPGWRPRRWFGAVLVALGYTTAVVAPGETEWWTIVFGAGLAVVGVARFLGSSGRVRRERLVALGAAAVIAIATVGGAVVRLSTPSGAAVDAMVLLYEAVLIGAAASLALGLRAPSAAAVADLVVDLDEAAAEPLRDAFAKVLGDPSLELGFVDASGEYVDVRGRSISIPGVSDSRTATFVERDAGPFAVLVHDASVLRDLDLVDAVATATRLSSANVLLDAEVREQLADLIESRRRLVTAADEERERLEVLLHEGAEQHLRTVDQLLERAGASAGLGLRAGATDHIARAQQQLEHTLADLHEIAGGLHPRELEGGLGRALRSLAERTSVPVDVSVIDEPIDKEIAVAVYFVCAEALANVTKHSAAHRATVEVSSRPGQVRIAIADDGVGGADLARGSGLQGLTDRVEALGGTLHIASNEGGGTRLVAELPLGDQRTLTHPGSTRSSVDPDPRHAEEG